MKKTFLVALAVVLVSSLILSGCAKPTSEGQEVTFPDGNLEECVRQALGKSAGEKITTTELAELTSLTCRSRDITDLSGLEYCTSLTELRLVWNQIRTSHPSPTSPTSLNSSLRITR